MIDYSLTPKLMLLKQEVERLKTLLELQYSKKLIEKAFYEYLQKEQALQPEILLPTKEAVLFYRRLCNKKMIEEVILGHIKANLLKDLSVLGLGENESRAQTFLQRFRLSRLKEFTQPGTFTDFLLKKGMIQKSALPAKPNLKRVQFSI